MAYIGRRIWFENNFGVYILGNFRLCKPTPGSNVDMTGMRGGFYTIYTYPVPAREVRASLSHLRSSTRIYHPPTSRPKRARQK